MQIEAPTPDAGPVMSALLAMSDRIGFVSGFSVSGTRPHGSVADLLCWETPADRPDCGREDLKHTRLSSWLAYVVHCATEGLNMPDPTRVGVVSASRFGCVAATDETRKGLRRGGILGIDPVRFAKATHVYPVAVAAMERGWQGPVTAFVGGEEAAQHALLFAADQIQLGSADMMIVAGYEELADEVVMYLERSGYLAACRAAGRVVAETMSVVVLARHETEGVRWSRPRLKQGNEALRRQASGGAEPLPTRGDALGATLIRDLVFAIEAADGAGTPWPSSPRPFGTHTLQHGLAAA